MKFDLEKFAKEHSEAANLDMLRQKLGQIETLHKTEKLYAEANTDFGFVGFDLWLTDSLLTIYYSELILMAACILERNGSEALYISKGAANNETVLNRALTAAADHGKWREKVTWE